ncbi:hypothetical protein L1049_012788 [Liquidambar formosana]|uniref:Uncharacterized protein n=1 Tax=Liquidambar formosana TaxID=63359 RepID=A0AAP0WWZ4_LIQFO
MDISIQYADSISEDISHPPDWEQLSISYRQCTSAIGDNLVAELGSALTEVLRSEDVQVLLSTSNAPSNGCDICCLKEDKACEQSKVYQAKSLIATSKKSLGEYENFPCSSNMTACNTLENGEDEISGTSFHRQSCSESGSPACDNTTLKLISAMKGGREKQGLRLEKVTVTWAPDVYDPPATSLSHTVKNHDQQCSRMDKRSGKPKHKHKSKSSRSNSIGKKKQYRKSVGSCLR